MRGIAEFDWPSFKRLLQAIKRGFGMILLVKYQRRASIGEEARHPGMRVSETPHHIDAAFRNREENLHQFGIHVGLLEQFLVRHVAANPHVEFGNIDIKP